MDENLETTQRHCLAIVEFYFLFFPNDDGTDDMKAKREKEEFDKQIAPEEGRGASRSTMEGYRIKNSKFSHNIYL